MKRKFLLTLICLISVVYVVSFSASAQAPELFFESTLTEDNTEDIFIERFR